MDGFSRIMHANTDMRALRSAPPTERRGRRSIHNSRVTSRGRPRRLIQPIEDRAGRIAGVERNCDTFPSLP